MAEAWNRAGQTAREETRFDLSMRRVREMPQSEKTGRIRRGVIAGMLATAGAMFFRPKIPFLADAERRADVSMLFGPHIRAGDVRPIIDKIGRARAEGRPYHVFLMESPYLKKADMQKFIADMDAETANIRSALETLRSRGLPEKEAEDYVRNHYRSSPDFSSFGEFASELLLELAREGIRVMPVEYYDAGDLERISRAEEESNAILQGLKKRLQAGESIAGLQKAFEKEFYIARESDAIREKRIRENLQGGVFGEAKRFFPELENEPQIRAIGYLGLGHRQISMDFDNADRRVRYSEDAAPDNLSVKRYAARLGLGGIKTRKSLEQYSRRLVLGDFFDNFSEIAQGYGPKGTEIAQRGFNRAIRMGQAEFNELSRRTQSLNGMEQKVHGVISYLIGENMDEAMKRLSAEQ